MTRWLCAAALLVSATATAAADDPAIGPPDVIADCEQQLTALHAEFRVAQLPLRHTRAGRVCGAPQVVVYRGVAGGARYSPAPVVSCGLAIALARFDTLVQDAAQREFGQRVVRIGHIGTYNCRDMARFDLVSEHSFANAIDLASFVLANGRKLTVERDFGRPAHPPTAPASRFLRTLANRAFDEHVFSCVITEFFDPLHHNHIHVDMARYRVDGTR